MRIDGLQYANWSEKIFREMRIGELSAVHVTVAYHEGFRETVENLIAWNRWFERFPDLIRKGEWAADIDAATRSGQTAIFFGAQNASPIESDIGLIEILHTLGLRFMQLTYNNQSLLACGCYEAEDSGITRMGRQAIKEMNRVGLVVDMSHSGARSTIEAADISQRPITISHANPHDWCASRRNKTDDVIRAVAENGGPDGVFALSSSLEGRFVVRAAEFLRNDRAGGREIRRRTLRNRLGFVPGSTRFGCRMDARWPMDPRGGLRRGFGIGTGFSRDA